MVTTRAIGFVSFFVSIKRNTGQKFSQFLELDLFFGA